MTMSVEATPNANSALKTDGSFASYTYGDGTIGGFLWISTIEGSDNLSVSWAFQNAGDVEGTGALDCVAPSQIMQVDKKLNQGKINFNTASLTDCFATLGTGEHGIINLTLTGDPDAKPTKVKLDSKRSCGIDENGNEVCTKRHGTQNSIEAVATGTFDKTTVTVVGSMGTEKAIVTHSNK